MEKHLSDKQHRALWIMYLTERALLAVVATCGVVLMLKHLGS